MSPITRTDAIRYVQAALGDHLEDFDVEGIVTDVADQLGTLDFARMDDETDPASTIDFWGIVARHDKPVSSAALPGCPAWCQRDKGHEYDLEEPDGSLLGWHEGRLATVKADDGGVVILALFQEVRRTSDHHVRVAAPHIRLTAGDPNILPCAEDIAEYHSPHTLRDLGDAIRAAARRLDQLTTA